MSIIDKRFHPVIYDRTKELEYLEKDFVGREWLFEEIDNWVTHGDEQIFLLTGKPGVGKSAISSQLIRRRKDIIAHHFYIHFDLARVEPSIVLRHLSSQIMSSFPSYHKKLGIQSSPNCIPTLKTDCRVEFMPFDMKVIYSAKMEDYYTEKPQEIINDILKPFSGLQLLVQPSIILIDAINVPVSYVWNEDGTTALNWLIEAVLALPTWIKYVFTSRDDQRVFDALKSLRVLNCHLAPHENQNIEDIRIYLNHRTSSLKIKQQLSSLNFDLETVITHLKEHFSGNFLLIKNWLDIIESEEILPDEIVLGKLYQKLLQEFFLKQVDWEEKGKPLVGILAVVKDPIMETQLLNFANLDENVGRRVLSRMRQFLDVIKDDRGSETFTLFQESLREYLIDKEINRYFWCDAEEHHNKIADYYFSQIF